MKRKIPVLFLFFIFLTNSSFANTLDFYILTALNKSPLLKDLNNQLLSARFDSLILRATFKPQITESTQLMYPFTGRNFGYDEAITNGGNYSSLIQLVKPLFHRKIMQGGMQTLSLNSGTIQINQRITEMDLKKSVTTQYLTAYSNFLQYQSNKAIIKILQDEENVVRQLVTKGIYLVTDYMNLTVSIQSQRIAVKQSFMQFKNDLSLLNFLCGVSDTTTVGLDYPTIPLFNSYNVNQSPLMQQFRIDSLKNLNAKTLIDLNYRPKINVLADGGFASVIPANIPHNFGASIGLSLIMPIYDGKQRQLEYKKLSFQENTRVVEKDFYVGQYKQQWLQLTEQLKLTDDLMQTYRNQLKDQERLIELYKAEIQEGLVRFMDFVMLVTNYTATRNNFSQTEINRLQIINQMNYLK